MDSAAAEGVTGRVAGGLVLRNEMIPGYIVLYLLRWNHEGTVHARGYARNL